MQAGARLERGDSCSESLRPCSSELTISPEEHQKLLTAITGDAERVGHGGCEGAAGRTDDKVSNLMAIGVVDALEIVEVDDDGGERCVRIDAISDDRFRKPEKSNAVGQSREHVRSRRPNAREDPLEPHAELHLNCVGTDDVVIGAERWKHETLLVDVPRNDQNARAQAVVYVFVRVEAREAVKLDYRGINGTAGERLAHAKTDEVIASSFFGSASIGGH